MNPQQTISISALRHAAGRGDREAVAALRDIALQAIAALDSLTCVPADHPDIPEPIRAGVATAHELAKNSHHWPVSVPALEDGRDKIVASRIPSSLGVSLPYRVNYAGRGKPRCAEYTSRLGFTLDVFQELERANRFPIGAGHAEIVAVCMEWLENECGGEWDGFPWPDQVQGEARREPHRKTATEHVLRKWITEGVKTLVS